MSEEIKAPNTDPIEAIEQARLLFDNPIYGKKQREGDVEIIDRGTYRYGDRSSQVRLFKPGTKTVVDTVIDASQESEAYGGDKTFSASLSLKGEEGLKKQYDTSYKQDRKFVGNYNVWDTVAPTTTKVEEASTTVTKYDGKDEVYKHTYKNPEIAKKVASIASKRIISQVENQLDRELDITELIERLRQDLPAIAYDLVSLDPQNDVVDYLGKSYPDRAEYFRSNPDDYMQHAPKWHQHGIVTHSREFAIAIRDTIPGYIKKWGIEDSAEVVLSQRIDGVEKRQLLEIVGLLHDIGKFSSRVEEVEESSITGYSFTDHEEHSGKILRAENSVSDRLKGLGLTPAQIEYIARCAELHFELGKVRRVSKASGGYNMAFVETPAFFDATQEILDKYPEFALEIGLLFIADCLSKSEVQASGTTDEEIESETAALEAELLAKGFNPKLINQAKQMPVNLKVARAYLTQWAETK